MIRTVYKIERQCGYSLSSLKLHWHGYRTVVCQQLLTMHLLLRLLNPQCSQDQKKFFGSYPKFVNYLLKIVSDNRCIPKTYFTFLQYTEQASLNFWRCADDLCARSCKVTGAYGKSILSDVCIERVRFFNRQRCRDYWASDTQADLSNVMLRTQLLLSTQKRSTKSPYIENQNVIAVYYGEQSWYNKTNIVGDRGPPTSPNSLFDKNIWNVFVLTSTTVIIAIKLASLINSTCIGILKST